jgi:hypothetical protein
VGYRGLFPKLLFISSFSIEKPDESELPQFLSRRNRAGIKIRGIVPGIVSKFEAKSELIFFNFFREKTMQINP